MRRYRNRLLFSAALFFTCAMVFAGGGPDTDDRSEDQFNEWTLAVTAFDTSALPASRQIYGTVLLRSLLGSLGQTEYRIRGFEELEYYQEIASSRSQSEAARALAAKQNERDLLLFRGEPGWRYTRNLAAVDKDIMKLEEDFLALQARIPYITPIPSVKIQDDNNSGWPDAPETGDEYVFCTGRKADAFLAGRVTEYYGRIFLTLRLYTLYTRSYSWESSILFSSDEMNYAVSEISGRLAAAVSGVEPAGLTVQVSPEDAMILIDDKWAGRGTVPLHEQTPGTVTVTSYSDRYLTAAHQLEIFSGEITELQFNLTPLGLSSFTVDVPGSPDSSVFLGSLFAGKTPLTLEMPEQISFITVETPSGETGTAVYRSGSPVRESAEFITGNTLSIKTGVPVSPEEKRVSTARNNFYSAYGRLWIALPASLLAIGMADNYVSAYNFRNDMDIYKQANAGSIVKIAAYVVIGLAAGETVYRIVRYLITSGANADPIARFNNTEPENRR